MTTDELWDYFKSKQVHTCIPFDREFIWIRASDFTPITHYFKAEMNLLHPEESFRSRHIWKHIHVLKQGKLVHAHIDTGNVTRSYVLYSLPHFIFDIIPYLYFAARKGVTLSSLFDFPSRNN